MDKIINNIFKTPLSNVILWSERNKKAGYYKKFKNRMRRFLINLSGNDLTSMLFSILNKNEKEVLHQKYIKALKGISVAVNHMKKKANIII